MAKARLYALDTDRISKLEGRAKNYVATLKGQAKIVFDDMAENATPRLAVDIEKSCGSKIVTRQDVFRVVLYYILVFKGKGLVRAYEPDVENEPENAFSGLIASDN